MAEPLERCVGQIIRRLQYQSKNSTLIEEGGFNITDLDEMYVPSTPKIAGYTYWGARLKSDNCHIWALHH